MCRPARAHQEYRVAQTFLYCIMACKKHFFCAQATTCGYLLLCATRLDLAFNVNADRLAHALRDVVCERFNIFCARPRRGHESKRLPLKHAHGPSRIAAQVEHVVEDPRQRYLCAPLSERGSWEFGEAFLERFNLRKRQDWILEKGAGSPLSMGELLAPDAPHRLGNLTGCGKRVTALLRFFEARVREIRRAPLCKSKGRSRDNEVAPMFEKACTVGKCRERAIDCFRSAVCKQHGVAGDKCLGEVASVTAQVFYPRTPHGPGNPCQVFNAPQRTLTRLSDKRIPRDTRAGGRHTAFSFISKCHAGDRDFDDKPVKANIRDQSI